MPPESNVYSHIQRKLEKSSRLLRDLFDRGLESVKAQRGFLGFEDLAECIQIFAHRGKYYHLSKTQGFTGSVYTSKKAAIIDDLHTPETPQGDKIAKQTEMASPVFLNGNQIVGVMLVDRDHPLPFDNDDLEKLKSITREIGDLLSDKLPWPFRDWWQEHEELTIEGYRSELIKELVKALNEHDNIFAVTGLVQGDDIVNRQPIELGQHTTRMRKDLAKRVLKSGKAEMNPTQITRGELAVPFPSHGPTKGIVLVESYSDHHEDEQVDDPTSLQSVVSQIIHRTDYGYHRKEPSRHDPASMFYSLLLKCESHHQHINRTIDSVRDDIRAICDTNVRIYLESNTLDAAGLLSSAQCLMQERKVLESYFVKSDLEGKRPHHTALDGEGVAEPKRWLRCPIWLNGGLVGVIEALREGGNDDEYNGPILEVASSAIAKVVGAYLAQQAQQQATQLCRDWDGDDKDLLLQGASIGQRVLGSDLFVAWMDSEDGREAVAVTGFDCTPTDSDAFVSLLNQLNELGVTTLSINAWGKQGAGDVGGDLHLPVWDLARSHKVRSLLATQIEIEPGRHFGLMGCSVDEGGSTRLEFSQVDVANIEMLGHLFAKTALCQQRALVS